MSRDRSTHADRDTIRREPRPPGAVARPRRSLFARAWRWAALAAVLCGALAAPAGALTVGGGISTHASGGTTQYVPLTQPETTTGNVQTQSACGIASGMAGIHANAGALVLQVEAHGGGGQGCVADPQTSGTVSYSDNFTVQSATLPAGTPVDLFVCVRTAFRHGVAFACNNIVYEGSANTAHVTASLQTGSTSSTLAGAFAESVNCFDGYQTGSSGALAGGMGNGGTLTLLQVPVGALVTVSATIEASAAITSFLGGDASHVELVLTTGVSASGPVQLVSTTTQQTLATNDNCTENAASAWLPPPPAVLDATPRAASPALAMSAPWPNPTRGGVTLRYALPAEGDVDVAVYDVAGARVATLVHARMPAGEREARWSGRDDAGRAVRAGVYWVRLVTPTGRATRMVAVR